MKNMRHISVKEKQIITKFTNYRYDAMELKRIILWVIMGVQKKAWTNKTRLVDLWKTLRHALLMKFFNTLKEYDGQ
jgi:hypothetical protein